MINHYYDLTAKCYNVEVYDEAINGYKTHGIYSDTSEAEEVVIRLLKAGKQAISTVSNPKVITALYNTEFDFFYGVWTDTATAEYYKKILEDDGKKVNLIYVPLDGKLYIKDGGNQNENK